jgi:hypothetical protein
VTISGDGGSEDEVVLRETDCCNYLRWRQWWERSGVGLLGVVKNRENTTHVQVFSKNKK